MNSTLLFIFLLLDFFRYPRVVLQCGFFGRHGIYRKPSALLYNTICFRLTVFFVLNSFEQHIRIELISPAWQAGTLTVVLMLLIKYTRTNWIRTSTDCRIKTFRSTVLHLQGTHPFPFCGEGIPIPPHSSCLFVLLVGFEPTTFCVSDRCSKNQLSYSNITILT